MNILGEQKRERFWKNLVEEMAATEETSTVDTTQISKLISINDTSIGMENSLF